jgi:hypothetical protein
MFAHECSSSQTQRGTRPRSAIIVGITYISDYGYDGDASVTGDCILSNGTVTDNHGYTYTRVVQGEPIR